MTLKRKISELIKQCRKDYNMSQRALAEDLGVSQPTVKRWENGSAYPNLSSLKKMEVYFEVTLQSEYAVYKGDELLAMGTIDEVAEKLGASVASVLYIGTPHYEGRTDASRARRLVKIEEVAE